MSRLQAFNNYCLDEDLWRNCEDDEKSLAIGPIKTDPKASAHNQPIYYFAYDDQLNSLSFDFHMNESSRIATRSFIYMLIKKDHINVDDIEDYLSMSANPPSEY